ncbi:MAG: hypothetical protein ONB23_03555, partial [candidate division KSB1 bacterium]|nr:hypothetical protein [candidate division KSB1 bacterium]
MRTHWVALVILACGIQLSAVPAYTKPGDVLSRRPSPGPCVTALAYDGKHLWIADRRTRLLYRYEPSAGQITANL